MASKLTFEQYRKITKDFTVDENGKTNKKCPLCGNDVIAERHGSVSTIKCATEDCFSSTTRGL